jgi:hypothetical protein
MKKYFYFPLRLHRLGQYIISYIHKIYTYNTQGHTYIRTCMHTYQSFSSMFASTLSLWPTHTYTRPHIHTHTYAYIPVIFLCACIDSFCIAFHPDTTDTVSSSFLKPAPEPPVVPESPSRRFPGRSDLVFFDMGISGRTSLSFPPVKLYAFSTTLVTSSSVRGVVMPIFERRVYSSMRTGVCVYVCVHVCVCVCVYTVDFQCPVLLTYEDCVCVCVCVCVNSAFSMPSLERLLYSPMRTVCVCMYVNSRFQCPVSSDVCTAYFGAIPLWSIWREIWLYNKCESMWVHGCAYIYLHKYIHTRLAYTLTCMHACIHTYIHTSLLVMACSNPVHALPTYMHKYIHTYTYIHVYILLVMA